ncbi:MAG: ABC transporter permease subunit [Paracoccus sp. (in: a-proteobacteria)]|uniref:ABC transporter permease n=1 Tax=Paracoccus sp. TaxID=267 RepID=UPI0026DFECD7|nr:ABC transporter permease subunit [Paracoccus sp. (in: a-proteobacteria)]MDO5632555.1 ABC transporter permease subunit [Paracoccus sp. (in: a-proteobacteria)]
MARAPNLSRRLGLWLGILPFAIFALLFLILPTLGVVVGAFRAPEGGFTLANLSGLTQPRITTAFWVSIRISFITALLGCVAGFLIAASVTRGGLPRGLRAPLMSFSGVAANFAGVPLAFAFIATLGRLGFVTVLMREWFGINIYASGFNLISFWGLVLTYLYFQIPLMVLVISPSLDGLKRDWREAAESLGASQLQYWRMVVLPIMWPAVLGAFALLFANAFGAVATAMALTGSSLSLVPIVLFAQIRGDVLQDPTLGYVIAFGMIVLTGVASLISIILRTRAERWLK